MSDRKTCKCPEENKKTQGLHTFCTLCWGDPNSTQGWEDFSTTFVGYVERELVKRFLMDKLFTSLGLCPASFEEWKDATRPYREAYESGDETIRAEFDAWFRLGHKAGQLRHAAKSVWCKSPE